MNQDKVGRSVTDEELEGILTTMSRAIGKVMFPDDVREQLFHQQVLRKAAVDAMQAVFALKFYFVSAETDEDQKNDD